MSEQGLNSRYSLSAMKKDGILLFELTLSKTGSRSIFFTIDRLEEIEEVDKETCLLRVAGYVDRFVLTCNVDAAVKVVVDAIYGRGDE